MIPVMKSQHLSNLAILAREIWHEHYTAIIGREQVDYMLEKFQSEAAIAEQIMAGYEYYLIPGDKGFCAYFAVAPTDEPKTMMLSKIYVKASDRGRGLGRQALAFAEQRCHELGADKLRLNVNRHNSRSIAWYLKMGFTKTGTAFREIGGGFVMDDYIMEKQVGRTPDEPR